MNFAQRHNNRKDARFSSNEEAKKNSTKSYQVITGKFSIYQDIKNSTTRNFFLWQYFVRVPPTVLHVTTSSCSVLDNTAGRSENQCYIQSHYI